MTDYVTEARKTYDNENAFIEFESMAVRWKNDKTWGAPPNWLRRKGLALRALLGA